MSCACLLRFCRTPLILVVMQVYSVALMREWTKELSGASSLQVEVVEGGTHFLTASHPDKVDDFLLAFVNKSGASKM